METYLGHLCLHSAVSLETLCLHWRSTCTLPRRARLVDPRARSKTGGTVRSTLPRRARPVHSALTRRPRDASTRSRSVALRSGAVAAAAPCPAEPRTRRCRRSPRAQPRRADWLLCAGWGAASTPRVHVTPRLARAGARCRPVLAALFSMDPQRAPARSSRLRPSRVSAAWCALTVPFAFRTGGGPSRNFLKSR